MPLSPSTMTSRASLASSATSAIRATAPLSACSLTHSEPVRVLPKPRPAKIPQVVHHSPAGSVWFWRAQNLQLYRSFCGSNFDRISRCTSDGSIASELIGDKRELIIVLLSGHGKIGLDTELKGRLRQDLDCEIEPPINGPDFALFNRTFQDGESGVPNLRIKEAVFKCFVLSLKLGLTARIRAHALWKRPAGRLPFLDLERRISVSHLAPFCSHLVQSLVQSVPMPRDCLPFSMP